MRNSLPSSIVSLIHHSKLNERGWWEKSISNLIIGVIAEHDNLPVSKEVVLKRLVDYQINIDFTRFDKQFLKLLKEGVILSFDNLFIVSEEYYNRFKKAYEDQIDVEEYSKNKFQSLLLKKIPSINFEHVWNEFNQNLLIPLVKENGVRIRDFINVGGKGVSASNRFQIFIDNFGTEADNMSSVIVEFLNPSDKNIKAFVIRLLNAYFFIEASNLNQDSLKEIYHLSEGKSKLDIYVDSNFLFSLLDLHENSYNEASQALLSVIEQAKEKVDVQFYILPATIEEIHKVVYANKMYLKDLRLGSLNLINRATEAIPFGFKRKYFDKCREAGIRLDVEQYFEPYDKNLLITIKNRLKIKVDEEPYPTFLEDFSSPQYIRINDDTLEMRDFRIAQMKAEGKQDSEIDTGKIYDKVFHDMCLWHIIASKRSSYASPRAIKYWIITLDSKLLAYDFRKQKKSNRLSVCLQPSDLMNLLQFWLPRNESLETAMFENFKLPLMFKDYDDEAEQVTLNILSAIALHENSENLSQKTIIEYETNNAIRSKIKSDTSVQEIAKIIQEYDELKAQKLAEDLVHERNKVALLEKETKEKERLYIIEQNKLEKEFRERQIALEKAKIEEEVKEREVQKRIKAEEIESKILSRQEDLRNLERQLNIAEARIKKETSGFLGFFKNYNEVRTSILSEYPDLSKIPTYNEELTLLSSKLERLNNPVIIKCENKNDKLFNIVGFEGLTFVGVHNSHDVFIGAKSNPKQFCIRDRDFLSDVEITNLRNRYPNLIILDYYCFENYLFHPDNMQEVLNGNFDKSEYINEVINQINMSKGKISTNVERARQNFHELKEEGVKDKNAGNFIYECLHSDNFEKMYKYFSVKDNLNKAFIQHLVPNELFLVKTEWFKARIGELIASIK